MLNTQARSIFYEFERDNKKITKMAVVILRHKIAYTLYYESNPNNFSSLKPIAHDVQKSLKFLTLD